jgi:prepilin-type N-terminal cleavage/methylation domain-containing protein
VRHTNGSHLVRHRPDHVVVGHIEPSPGPRPGGRASVRPSIAPAVAPAPSRARRALGNDDGFTLVELLVVVGVLVTLVGIAIPAFSAQQERAWDAAVRAQLRAGTIALASYQAQNASYSLDALDPDQGWGYETSAIVLAHWTMLGGGDSYCGLAWRRTDKDIEEGDLSSVATERAEFAATPEGIFPVTSAGTCP